MSNLPIKNPAPSAIPLCLFTGMFFGYFTWLIFLKINGGKPYLTPQDKLDIHRMTSEGGPVPKEYSAL